MAPTPATTDFSARLTSALTGAPDTPLVLLGNFEVEREWGKGEHALPRLSASGANAVVNHMDEFALLLGAAKDHVVLKSAPDPAYLEYLRGLGLDLPALHVARDQDPQRTVTEDALADPALLRELSGLAGPAGGGCRIAAHGISAPEERLAEETGIPLAGPGTDVCKAVNSKVYSRRIADELGLRQPRGWACDTLDGLDAAFRAVEGLLAAGGKAVIKEAFGVSGKGIATLEPGRRSERVRRMIAKQAERAGSDRTAFVIEEWVAKSADLNYQFTIARTGEVRFDFVKELHTEGGVHKGHRMPAGLTPGQHDELRAAADALGKRLAADGYRGVVGVDAMVDPDGGLYPVMEINARNNMSTYQARLQERFVGDGQTAVARHYPLRLGAPLPFAEARAALDGLLLGPGGGSGLLVNNYATVNAGFPADTTGAPVEGRLYGLVVADSAEELAALDAEIERTAERLAGGTAATGATGGTERSTHS